MNYNNIFQKFIYITLLCSLALIFMPQHTMAEQTYIIRADNNYPPYEYLDKNVPTGFNIDMIKAVAEVMNLNINIKMGPWNEVRTDLEEGRIDALAGMYYTAERDKKVDFSTPHVIVSQSIFVRKNSPIQSLEDLKDKEVIVQKGDVMHDFVINNKITAKVFPVENQEQAIRLLSSGKHDAAILSKLQTYYFMKKNIIDNVQAVGTAIQPQDYCFAVKEGDVKLQTQLNEGLKILKTNGTYKKIYSKWFGVYEEQEVSNRVIKNLQMILMPILIVILFIGIWTWSLKTQVNLKTRELKQSNDEIRILNESLEQRVKERTEEIHAINQELKDFAYIVSHDLKAPLRGISQVAKWLYDDKTLQFNSENRELMELLINRVHRMDNLITGILAYSKASRTTNLDNQVHVGAILERIVTAIAIPPTVTVNIQPNMPTIIGNEVRIEEAFQNLIANAIQHVDPSNGRIDVGYEEDENTWKFWVKDNGPGIDEKYFDKIFGMFQTLEARDNKESTGIGLTIVKKIAEIHYGHAWVESILGKGATFFFTIMKRGENDEI